MLRATGMFRAHQAVVDRVMDSNDQERERGITILAKAASVTWKGAQDQPRRHAGPRRLRRRGRAGADHGRRRAAARRRGRGPAAADPLRALEGARRASLPAVVVLNKVDRSDARPDEVLDEIYELFFDLDAADDHIDFPVISAVAREGRAMRGIGMPGADADLTPLFDAILDTIPAPDGDPDAPLQALVTNLDASDYLGRLAIGRVVKGTLRRGEHVALLDEESSARASRR